MCPPVHFGVLYEINPWMHAEVTVDRDLARAQWDDLMATLQEAGATVEVVEQDVSAPDMVFTANAGHRQPPGRRHLAVHPVPLPVRGAQARDRAVRPLVRHSGVRRRPTAGRARP